METFIKVWIKASEYILLRYFLIAGITYLIFYVVFERFQILKKLQKHLPPPSRIVSEILNSALTIVIFASMAALVFGTFYEQTNMYAKVSDYGTFYYIATFPLMFLIHDTYFYWLHRFMHLPVIFNRVHQVHHRSVNPTPWTSYSFHVAEGILEAAILPLIAFTLPVHKSALILFLLMQFIYNVYGHLGYEIYPKWLTRTYIGKWINTSTAHNMHHKYFNGNYGLYFLFWDRWMGTLDKRYEEAFEQGKV
jgi:Delta7-sterol 5-desaturase